MSITFWDVVSTYVKEKHPHVPIDPDNSIAGCYRFRIKVSKNTIEITDSGKSPGMKAPEDFPREIVKSADPGFFKKLSKICKYRGKGGVCVYRVLSKTLKAGWTIQSVPDLMGYHGISLEQELIGALTKDLKGKLK